MSENGSSYSLNRDVFLFMQDGIAQILDFKHGQFYGLDEIATLMVLIILEKWVEETVKEPTKIYEVTEENIRYDLTKLLQDLEQKSYLLPKYKRIITYSRFICYGVQIIIIKLLWGGHLARPYCTLLH